MHFKRITMALYNQRGPSNTAYTAGNETEVNASAMFYVFVKYSYCFHAQILQLNWEKSTHSEKHAAIFLELQYIWILYIERVYSYTLAMLSHFVRLAETLQ